MLIQFSFKNYKSFRDDTVLDLSATRISEHADRIIGIGPEKLLPTAAIYGANASGKSNVIEAFRFMSNYVVDSFAYGGEDGKGKNKTKRVTRTPFLFDEHSSSEVSTFEVYYITSEEEGCKTYNYGFSLDDNGVNEKVIGRRVPYTNMIYFGDGMTDIPAMILTKNNGGTSIAVYQEGQKHKVTNLYEDGRVNFISLADYSEGSDLENVVRLVMQRLALSIQLQQKESNLFDK